MRLPLRTTAPFSFHQTLGFVRRFPPCLGQYVVTDDALTAAVTIGGRATAFTVRAGSVELDRVDDGPAVLARAAHLVGATDDLTELYTRGASDRAFQPLLLMLYGLHHVRFLTLEEVAIYCVLTQRTPLAVAARMKQRLFERIGRPVVVGGATLYALPTFDELVEIPASTFVAAVGHKGRAIAEVVRGVAAIGETFLREAPYASARDELLAIRGIGPFSAALILLRGLGRMDEVPLAQIFEDEARILYGDAYDEAAIRARYGRALGYWAFYLKTGVARLRDPATAGPRMKRGSRVRGDARTPRAI